MVRRPADQPVRSNCVLLGGASGNPVGERLAGAEPIKGRFD